jgi:DMSO/TMAO reductase YedYZ molybdopterin-dependent catalytic subunit
VAHPSPPLLCSLRGPCPAVPPNQWTATKNTRHFRVSPTNTITWKNYHPASCWLRRHFVSKQAGRAFRGTIGGLAALVVFLGAAELVAIATGPASAPAIAIGQVVISHTPQSLKEFAIQHFGENDKDVLLGGIYTSFIFLAGFAGALAALTRRAVAVAAAGILAIVGAISAAAQPTASWLDALPSLAGGLAAAVTVGLLVKDGRPQPVAELASPEAQEPVFSRRRFLVAGSSLFALGAATYLSGARAVSTVYNAARSRAAVRLPAPVSATRRARGTSFDGAGSASYITANKDFYRVDTALVVPQLSTEGYTLALHGMVDRPTIFTFEDILGMGLVERTITMVCVSNPVGGPYIGTARWLGAPLKDILERSGLHAGADQLFMTSSDGMTIGADLAAVMDGRPAMLAVGMNGEPLPFEHGFPVRAIVPGIYGYASACKWLVDLEVTTFAAKRAYWVERGYAERAPIKLESKIDTPASFARLPAGMVSVGGSAWHPGVGISKVEVNVDNGPWHQAVLAAVESVDTWRLWHWEWHATPGTHSLGVRATDATGLVQTPADTGVVPNGASGRQSVVVTIA